MAVNGTMPSIRLDRYLALLALLLAIVLGFIVVGERHQAALPPTAVIGALPPPPDARLEVLGRQRDELVANAARLAAGLEEARQSLAATEAEIGQLNQKVEQLASDLATESEARAVIERRLAAVEAERDRLGAQVRSLGESKKRLEAELEVLAAAPEPAAAPVPLAIPEPPAAIEQPPASPGRSLPPETLVAPEPPVTPATTSEPKAEAEPPATGGSQPRRLTIFRKGEASALDGAAAYRAGEYAQAARIWSGLAAEGDARAQFYLGSMLYEGRSGRAPDLVMAYVWLSRAVAGGHLPAIEVRRRVRAAMSEAQYEEALAIVGTD